jgi:hypothetical protein
MTFTLSLDEKRDYDWACKVMLSCRTKEQNDNAFELVTLFYKKHENLTMTGSLMNLSTEVEQKIKLNEITN